MKMSSLRSRRVLGHVFLASLTLLVVACRGPAPAIVADVTPPPAWNCAGKADGEWDCVAATDDDELLALPPSPELPAESAPARSTSAVDDTTRSHRQLAY